MEPGDGAGRSTDVTATEAATSPAGAPLALGTRRPAFRVQSFEPRDPLAAHAQSPPDLAVHGLSFERFYAEEHDRIARAVAVALGDADLAAEATDEAFTRAFPRWSSLQAGNPGGWVYRVALNWALSVLRRRKVRRDRPMFEVADHTAPAVEPAVLRALADLDTKHRSVVVCRHLLGWSVADTAAALHLREGTVKSRLSRANQILQSNLHHLRSEEQA